MFRPIHVPGQSPRDWTEDFEGENGCYMNRCVLCECDFHGHKRRMICKVCDTDAFTEGC